MSEKDSILIIDDNYDHYLILARYLKDTYITDNLDGQSDTIPTIKIKEPICILLDYNLNIKNGIDILIDLKNDENLKEIPVIMLTSEKNPDVIINCMKNGADDYLIKEDVTKERLLTSLNIIIEKVNLKKHIEKLENFLPICSNCKKVRKADSNPKEQNSWEPIETYISSHTESRFSHGLCPECIQKLYGDLME